jgi:hypothetical protein
MSKISEIKEMLVAKIEKLVTDANIDEIEKLSSSLAHLDNIDRFDMTKIYQEFIKESNQSREDMSNFYNNLLEKFNSIKEG